MDEIQQLREENAALKRDLARKTGQLLKAYKDRAEIHARLRHITKLHGKTDTPITDKP